MMILLFFHQVTFNFFLSYDQVFPNNTGIHGPPAPATNFGWSLFGPVRVFCELSRPPVRSVVNPEARDVRNSSFKQFCGLKIGLPVF